MLQGEHSAILLTFIMLQFVIKIFVLSNFEWSFYTGFTVQRFLSRLSLDILKLHTMDCVIYIIIIYVTYFENHLIIKFSKLLASSCFLLWIKGFGFLA